MEKKSLRKRVSDKRLSYNKTPSKTKSSINLFSFNKTKYNLNPIDIPDNKMNMAVVNSQNIKDEMQNIEELIKLKNSKNAKNFNFYSKSLINPYVPLTTHQKVKEIEELEDKSINRFKKYSCIFDQIKKEIYDINNLSIHKPTNKNNQGLSYSKDNSNNINTSNINSNKLNIDMNVISINDYRKLNSVKKNTNNNFNSNKSNLNIDSSIKSNNKNFEYIEEKDEEYYVSPTTKDNKLRCGKGYINEFKLDSLSNNSDADDINLGPIDENKNNININRSKRYESMTDNRVKNKKSKFYRNVYNINQVNNYFNNRNDVGSRVNSLENNYSDRGDLYFVNDNASGRYYTVNTAENLTLENEEKKESQGNFSCKCLIQ